MTLADGRVAWGEEEVQRTKDQRCGMSKGRKVGAQQIQTAEMDRISKRMNVHLDQKSQMREGAVTKVCQKCYGSA